MTGKAFRTDHPRSRRRRVGEPLRAAPTEVMLRSAFRWRLAWLAVAVGIPLAMGVWLWIARRDGMAPPAPDRHECWAVPLESDPLDPDGRLPLRVRRCLDGAVMVLVVPRWAPALARAAPEDLHGPEQLPGPFYVDETEITQGRFDAYVRATGLRTRAQERGKVAVMTAFSTGLEWIPIRRYAAWLAWAYPGVELGSLPARQMTQPEAAGYATWVGCRLPTEAEFAYLLACDAGWGPYPWGPDVVPDSRVVNCADAAFARVFTYAGGMRPLTAYNDGRSACAPVASYLPNSLGLYDVSGNVGEYCRDLVRTPLDEQDEDYTGEGEPSYSVTRGGKWLGSPYMTLAVDYRETRGAELHSDATGFRCVRGVDPYLREFIGRR